MATKIPQNIDKEDKLVGPLTLKQFLYLLGGAAVTFLIYQYYAIGYLFLTEFVILGLIVIVFAVLLAFGQVNGRPFITFLANLFNFILIPKRRLWGKDNTIEARPVKVAHPTNGKPLQPKEVNRSQLEQLATILDTGGKMETAELSATHEMNLTAEGTAAPKINERNLGVEDVLSDTES